MTDLSDRLRRNGEIAGNAGRACNLYFEAADEIDRLTADLTAERAHACEPVPGRGQPDNQWSE